MLGKQNSSPQPITILQFEGEDVYYLAPQYCDQLDACGNLI